MKRFAIIPENRFAVPVSACYSAPQPSFSHFAQETFMDLYRDVIFPYLTQNGEDAEKAHKRAERMLRLPFAPMLCQLKWPIPFRPHVRFCFAYRARSAKPHDHRMWRHQLPRPSSQSTRPRRNTRTDLHSLHLPGMATPARYHSPSRSTIEKERQYLTCPTSGGAFFIALPPTYARIPAVLSNTRRGHFDDQKHH